MREVVCRSFQQTNRVILKDNFRGFHHAHHQPALSPWLHHAGLLAGSPDAVAT